MAYSFKGAIAFGLVYIPVALVASIKNNDIGFNMIDKIAPDQIDIETALARIKKKDPWEDFFQVCQSISYWTEKEK